MNLDKFCECKEIKAVARDGKSTCMTCGGIDAYKKSPRRTKEVYDISDLNIVKKGTFHVGRRTKS
jgi:hypothetical protein